jgi:pyridoxamine 5'-phosphate oxidase
MPLNDQYEIDRALPDTLPSDPFPVVVDWLREATERSVLPNPNAMTLATVDAHGNPRARIVLCKGIEPEGGCVVFFTNRTSDKGRELDGAPRVALVMHWDHLERQVRIEGPVTRTTEAEDDAYFATRHWQSRLGSWASDQSRPLASREELLERVADAAVRFDINPLADPESLRDVHIPRPPHWGGFRVWARRVELWISGPGRIHDRAAWTRELTPTDNAYSAGAWSSTRLFP